MIYDIGDTVTRTLRTSVAPVSSPTVTVTKPDATTAAGSVTGAHPDFTFSISGDQAGAWLVKWTVPGLGVERDGFYVRPDPTQATALIPVVTVTQAREFLRSATGTVAETATLARLCRSATLVCDYYVGLARTVTHTIRAVGTLRLPRRPLQQIISITSLDGSIGVTLTDLAIDSAPGVARLDNWRIYGRYRITYVGGHYPDEAIEQGALEWVLHRWRTSQAHSSSTYGDVAVLGDVPDLPNAVRQCWQPYLDDELQIA